MPHWHPTLQDPRYKEETPAWYHNTQVQGETRERMHSHPHTTHRESFTLTTDKLQSWCQPRRTFKTLGHHTRVMGSQVYASKPKPAPATNVIIGNTAFLWQSTPANMDPTVATGQILVANTEAKTWHSKTTLTQALWVRMWWEAFPPVPAWLEPNERAHAGKWAQPTANCMLQGKAVGIRELKSCLKANWKQSLLMLWKFETTVGGLKPFWGEISCQVWVIAQIKAGMMCKWVINIKRQRWETYNGMADKTLVRALYIL